MMPVHKKIVDFSSNGEYLAYSSPDGCLKIWETSTNILKQEYTPTSHLSATCSAISWCPNKPKNHTAKKLKKLKKDNDFSVIADLQLIAMGTLTGEILLYSYVNADLHSFLSNGHSSVVNDLCWSPSTSSLYSCSNDKNIIIWDVFGGKVKTKWKADNVAIHSICVLDSNNILSASNSIKWWNVEEKTVIKTFTGHATEIFKLLPIRTEGNIENSYFLSAAVDDRIINAWQLNEESSKRAHASFVASDEPENLSYISENDQTWLSVVCKDGSLHIFEHVLNGRRKKPLQSKFTVQIASKASESLTKPQKVPILCATLSLGLSSCLISYGTLLRPSCEKIDMSEVSKDLFLIRDISGSNSPQEVDISRIKHTDKSEVVKLLAPGHMMPVKDLHSVPRKRKKESMQETELPIEERLRALDLSKIPPNVDEPVIRTDSMVHLLLQGLQSKDNNLLNMVLQCSDEHIIQNTLKRLPLPSIKVLLKEMQIRLTKQEPSPEHPYLKWMENLHLIHLPYLMSCKDIDMCLGPISQLMEARVENFLKMCQLQGQMKILLSQISPSTTMQVESDKPLAVYQSDSSEESESDEKGHNGDISEEHSEDVGLESSSSESNSETEMDS